MDNKNQPLFPNGIMLNLFKQVNASQVEVDKLTQKTPEINTLIAFGNFDRLCFKPVFGNFSDYRKLSCEGHEWIGGKKEILLYALSPFSNVQSRTFGFTEKGSENKTWEIGIYTHHNMESKKVARKFLSVSTFYVSGRIKNIGIEYADLLQQIQEVIDKTVSVVNKSKSIKDATDNAEILFEVFGSINPTEIVILWASDQYVDIQYIVDQLRYLRIKIPSKEAGMASRSDVLQVFLATYTIVALTAEQFDSDNVRGSGMIQLAGATDYSSETSYDGSNNYVKEVMQKANPDNAEKDMILHCAGEYDIICPTLAKGFTALAKRGNNGSLPKFNYKNEEYKKFFSSTTTRLCYKAEDIAELKALNLVDYMEIIPKKDSFSTERMSSLEWNVPPAVLGGCDNDPARKAFLDYKTKLVETINRPIAGFLYNLDLLFCDYVQCISALPDVQWAKDFETQFHTAITLLIMLIPEKEKQISAANNYDAVADYIDIAQEIIDILKQQIHHLSDAGKLSFEEPSTHSESTSQYDLVLHTFYGIIKSIMEAVSVPLDSCREKPTRLMPILRFSSKPIIKSVLYTDDEMLDVKLVDICIPYDACGEPGFYSPVLIHEVFHYIPPADRSIRNEAFAKVLVTEVLVDAFQQILGEYSPNDLSDVSLATNTIRNIIFSYFEKRRISGRVQYPNESKVWNEFSQCVYAWLSERADPDDAPLGTDLTGVIDYLGKKLHKSLAEEDIYNAQKQSAIKWLDGELESPESKDALIKKIKQILRDFGGLYDDIAQQLRELFPDHQMLAFSQIELVDYLLLNAIAQEKQNVYAENRNDSLFLEFRLGFVVDSVLFGFDENPEKLIPAFASLRPAFCQKYNMYVKTVTYKSDIDPKESAETVDQGQAWFTFFESIIQKYVRALTVYRPTFQHLYDKAFSAYKPVSEQPWRAIKQFFSNISMLTDDQRAECEKKAFVSELNVIHAAQPQRFLSEIDWATVGESARPCEMEHIRPTRSITCRKTSTYAITSIDRFTQPIKEATYALCALHEKAFGKTKKHPELWYRGISNAEYEILPSILRKYQCTPELPNTPLGQNRMGTLADYQRFCLEQFKYKADGAPEIITPTSYKISDFIALMQHYAHPTCYLDWSDDAFTSLFFALEEYFPSGDKAAAKKRVGDTAALYIMDPLLYNRARKMLIKKHAGQILCQLKSLPNELAITVSEEMQGCKIIVPNVSVGYAEEQFGVYSMKLIHQNGLQQTAMMSDKDPKEVSFADIFTQEDLWNLPLAIHTSRLNPRIRAQSGSFLAYSIFSRPVFMEKENDLAAEKCKNKRSSAERFSYLSLQKIQEFFLTEFPNEGPFMVEVQIKPGVKQTIADYLQYAGINKYRIYPELENTKSTEHE